MNYLRNHLRLFLLAQIFLNLLFSTTKAIPQTPCPQIFKYKHEQGIWFGEVRIVIHPSEGQALLQLQYTLSKHFVNDYRGSIAFASDEKDVINSIDNNLPVTLLYRFVFPFQDVLPAVEFIKLNNKLYCQGQEDPNRVTGNIFTHQIKWGTPQPTSAPPVVPVQNNYQRPQPQQPQPLPAALPTVASRPQLPIPRPVQDTVVPSNPSGASQQDITEICGVYPPTVVQLVVNGEAAGQQPWLVSMYEGKGLSYEYFCAGNLISDRHVLTAAHCVRNKQNIYIKVGKKTLTSRVEPNQKIRVHSKIYTHPEYQHPRSHADIAIVLLNEPVTFATNIRPLCLWPYETDLNKIVGSVGTVVGWGKNENGDLEQKEPKKASVRIVSQEACSQQEVFKNIISDKTFCAIGANHAAGPCLGDSGGAMTMYLNKKWVVRGVISATVGDVSTGTCDVENYYSVYSDVAKYLDWIYDVLRKD